MRLCCACRQLKAETEFSWRRRRRVSGDIYMVLHCRCCECQRVYSRQQYHLRRTPELQARYNERARTKLRRLVFEHYGLVCAACGESDFGVLTIDHVNNDGAEHRRRVFGNPRNGGRPPSGHWLYWWLKRNNYPPGFQVLCQNCNFAKHKNGGVIPSHRFRESSVPYVAEADRRHRDGPPGLAGEAT